MPVNNEIVHTVSDLSIGVNRGNLSNFIQDLQQQRVQHPQDTHQYLADCNSMMQQTGVLPQFQLEGLNASGDRFVLKASGGLEISVGADGKSRALQPGEKASAAPAKPADATSRPADTSKSADNTGNNPTGGRGGDTAYTVKSGDTLWGIARKKLGHDASEKDVYALVKSIAKENGMSKINQTIYPDQILKIPGDGSQAAPPSKPTDAVPPAPQSRPAEVTPKPQSGPGAPDAPQPNPDDSSQPTNPAQGDQTAPSSPPADQSTIPGNPVTRPGEQSQLPGGSDATTDRVPDHSQMEAMARKQAIKVLNEHMNDIANLAAVLPDGKFPVGMVTAMLDGPLGKTLDPHTLAMLQNVQSIEKHGNHIEIDQKSDTKIPLNIDQKDAVIDDLKVGHKLSFDLSRDASGHNQLSNVQGISVEGHTTAYKGLFAKANHSFDAPLQTVTINRDASGNTVFDAQFKNPANWLDKIGEKVTHQYTGEHVNASIQLNDDGTVTVSDPNSNVKRRIA